MSTRGKGGSITLARADALVLIDGDIDSHAQGIALVHDIGGEALHQINETESDGLSPSVLACTRLYW